MAVIASGAVLDPGCDESLPPRLTEPNALRIEAYVSASTGVVQQGVLVSGGEIFVRFENTYVEVLQDSAQISVACDVRLDEYPEAAAHFVFGQETLEDRSVVSGSLLTLPPGKISILAYRMSETTAGGKPFWHCVPLAPVVHGQNVALESPVLSLTVEGSIQIFKKLPAYPFPRTTVRIQYQVWSDSIGPSGSGGVPGIARPLQPGGEEAVRLEADRARTAPAWDSPAEPTTGEGV